MSHVVLVCPYSLSVFGGVQEQALAMSRVLVARGHDVELVAPGPAGGPSLDTPARVHRLGAVLAVPANGSRAPITMSWRAARRLRAIVETVPGSVVHLHEPFAPLLGWSELLHHGAPTVGTLHRAGAGPATRWTTPVLRRLARGLDVVAAVSPAAADTMGRAAGLHPDVLFNGFETARFRRETRQSPEAATILLLGRLEERKGAAVALEAVMRHNARTTTPWRVVVLGDGPLGGALRARFGADPAIDFLGAADEATKLWWLRHASVLVAPALGRESFGLVLLEAMAAELPVVASDIPGYREAAGGHASLARPGDPADLERAIGQALAAPVSQVAAAREHAEQWSMDRLVGRYEDLYDRARGRFAGRR